MSTFLVSYRPLAAYRSGQEAISKHKLPPFIDYSCRKEPDFLSVFPSITALCRKAKFAPRLETGDVVVYITCKGTYQGFRTAHWRLTAVLEVYQCFDNHINAAAWYEAQHLPLPSNCMVKDNPSVPIERTAPITPFKTDLHKWDLEYWRRSRECGVFRICRVKYLELTNPSVVTDEIMHKTFGRIPGTQNPPKISETQFAVLLDAVNIEI